MRTDSGRKVGLHVPKTPWNELERLREQYANLTGKLRSTAGELDRLAGEREAAVAEDRRRLGRAIRQDKAEPDDSAVQKVDGKIQAANRRREAIELAIEVLEREILALVERNQGRWQRDVDDRVARARTDLAKQLEEYVAARRALMEELALAGFVRHFLVKPQKAWIATDAPVLLLRGRNDEPFIWAEVERALREDAVTPPPPERPPAQPLVPRPTVLGARAPMA